MMTKLTKESPDWQMTLETDAMYYNSAHRAYDSAVAGQKTIKDAEENFKKLELEKDRILKRYKDDSDAAYDELEPIFIQMESGNYELGTAYGPVLQSLATVHILSAASLETHINLLGKELLPGKDWDHFERLGLEAKWLFLPRLLGHKGFDPGSNPFQDFAQLIRYRNLLVHYKGHAEAWQDGRPPRFLETLGLTTGDARKSLATVKNMITAIRKDLKQALPTWLSRFAVLKTSNMNFFKIYFPGIDVHGGRKVRKK
jgi:hypothetical protein